MHSPTYNIFLGNLLLYCDPVSTPPWEEAERLTKEDVWRAYHNKSFEANHVGHNGTEERHVRRIAWLMHHGWNDPIHIDVGLSSSWGAPWIVEDGNHRLYAAALLQHATIPALVSGSLSLAESLFGDLVPASN